MSPAIADHASFLLGSVVALFIAHLLGVFVGSRARDRQWSSKLDRDLAQVEANMQKAQSVSWQIRTDYQELQSQAGLIAKRLAEETMLTSALEAEVSTERKLREDFQEVARKLGIQCEAAFDRMEQAQAERLLAREETVRISKVLFQVKEAVAQSDCDGNEDCDHCHILHEVIEPTEADLALEKKWAPIDVMSLLIDEVERLRAGLKKLSICGGGCDGPMGCMCKTPIAREVLGASRSSPASIEDPAVEETRRVSERVRAEAREAHALEIPPGHVKYWCHACGKWRVLLLGTYCRHKGEIS